MNILFEGTIIDRLMIIRLLKLLVTPFAKTDAFKYGIIDAKGNNLISYDKLKTNEQRESYSVLVRFVFNLKKILNKIPGGDNYIKNGVAALLLMKESNIESDQINIEKLTHILEMIDKGYIFIEEQLLVEMIMEDGVVAGVLSGTGVPSLSGGFTSNIDVGGPTNNTNQAAGHSKKLKLTRRKQEMNQYKSAEQESVE